MNNELKGHLMAAFSAAVWGTTFISTKVLLKSFSPVEIMMIRFLIGYLTLSIIYPKEFLSFNFHKEKYMALAGLIGIVFYFVFENTALTYTTASNAGIITSSSPIFTAIIVCFCYKTKTFTKQFFTGFILAITGICIVSYAGQSKLNINPIGDFLSLCSCISWSFYSTILKKVNTFGYNMFFITRRIFAYGILFIIPVALFTGIDLSVSDFSIFKNSFNLIYLGVFASGLCYITWNNAIKIIGPVKTSAYVYAMPAITILVSIIVIHERITIFSIIGTLFILTGLILSESNFSKKSIE